MSGNFQGVNYTPECETANRFVSGMIVYKKKPRLVNILHFNLLNGKPEEKLPKILTSEARMFLQS